MLLHQKTKHSRFSPLLFTGILCIAILLSGLINYLSHNSLYELTSVAIGTVVSYTTRATDTTTSEKSSLAFFLHSKEELMQENQILKKQIQALTQKSVSYSSDMGNIQSLCSIVNPRGDILPRDEQNYILGKVTGYDDLLFGTIRISYSSEEEVVTGSIVLDDLGYAIGTVHSIDTTSQTAIVSLFSETDKKTQIRINGSEIFEAVGEGGVTLMSVLPKSIVISVDEPVVEAESGIVLGTVAGVIHEDADPSQQIVIRLSTVPSLLRYVTIRQ